MITKNLLKVPFARLKSRSITRNKPSQTKQDTSHATERTASSSQSTAEKTHIVASTSESLWEKATDQLSNEDKKTIACYISSAIDIDTIPELLLQDVRTKRDICESKRWIFHCGKKAVKLKDMAENVLAWLGKFKEVGDIATNADPVHAGLPWAGIRLLLQATLSEREQMEALLRGLDRITYILLRFLAKATRVYERNHAAFWTTSDILHFERECQDLERRAESEPQNCERYLNAAERVKASKAREYLSQMPKMEDLQGLITQVDDIWSTLQKQEMNEILQWLSKIPYQDHHKTACEGRTPGTGEWIFENESYLLWQKSCKSEIFWLHGIPGAGKTKLTSRVVDRWLKTQSHDNTVAYFYCNYKQESRRDPQKILQSLVKQTAKCPQRDSIHHNTVDFYRRNQNIGGGSAELSFAESEDMLCELAQGYYQVTLILDALDECNQWLRGKLIKAFGRLITQYDKNIKVFISSRRDDDIKRRLENRVNIGLEVTNNADDIDKFVRQRIEDGQYDRRKPICSSLKDEIVMALGEKSQGMFQWAALQIEQILCLGLERDIRLRLGRLPHDLKTAYDEILDRIKSSTGSTPIISMRDFQWVLFSYKPLSPEALVTLISKDPLNDESELSDLDIYFVLDACDNLLVVDEEANICRFSHFSVQEYLQEHHYSPEEPNRIECAQAELASMAIRCILQTNEGQICGGMLKPIPGMRYAAAYWYHHARVALDAGPHQQLQVLIDRLFSGRYTKAYTNWLDVWNPDSSMRVQGTREFPGPLYYASLLGFQASVEKMLGEGAVVRQEGRFGNAFVASAVRSHSNIAKLLLDMQPEVDTGDLYRIMRKIKGKVDSTLAVLLESGALYDSMVGPEGHKKVISEMYINAAASNASHGDSIIAFLLHNSEGETPITAGMVETAAKNEMIAHKVMAVLLQKRGTELPITKNALKLVIGNWRCGEKVLSLLLEHGIAIPVTEDVINQAVRNGRCGEKALPLLIKLWSSDITITEGVILNATRNPWNGDKLMALILSKWGPQTPITEAVLMTAAGNCGVGEKIMTLLLGVSEHLVITEEIVKKAAVNWGVGDRVFSLMLDKLDQGLITEDVMMKVAGNWGVGESIISLLKMRFAELPVTQNVVKVAEWNTESTEQILGLLGKTTPTITVDTPQL